MARDHVHGPEILEQAHVRRRRAPLLLRLHARPVPYPGAGQFPGLCPAVFLVGDHVDGAVPGPAAIPGVGAGTAPRLEVLVIAVLGLDLYVVDIIGPRRRVGIRLVGEDELYLVDPSQVETAGQLREKHRQRGPGVVDGLPGRAELEPVGMVCPAALVKEPHPHAGLGVLGGRDRPHPEGQAVMTFRLGVEIPGLHLGRYPGAAPSAGERYFPGIGACMFDRRPDRRGPVDGPAVLRGSVVVLEVLVDPP